MSRFLSLAWNEDPAIVGLYIAEGMRPIKKSRAMLPVIVDARGGQGASNVELILSDARDPAWPKGTKSLAGAEVPVVRADALPGALAAWAKRCDPSLCAQTTFIVLPASEAQAAAAAAIGTALFVARPASDTASALYAFLKETIHLGRKTPTVAIVISGCERIETAAEYFRGLSAELTNLSPGDQVPEFVFAGTLCFDPERMTLARYLNRSYGELYEDDSSAGRFAYLGRQLATMLEETLVDQLEDPLNAISALVKSGPIRR